MAVHKINIVNTLILLLNICGISCLQAVPVNDHFLLAPAEDMNRSEWLGDARQYRDSARSDAEQKAGANTWHIYDREDLRWMSSDFTCRMCMIYDVDFYDPSRDEYLIDSVLADGVKEFGGYNSIVLWQAYPRLGIDERNQFDFYRDMPGGLARIKTMVDRCHSKNVRVFIDYNPWDTGTRREAKSDYEMLADVIAAIGADGVFLDTLSEGSEKLRSVLDKAKPGIAIVSEGHPPVEQLAICSGSWGQWLDKPKEPGILKLKWIEPRHMQYQIRRWDRDRSDEVEIAFFNKNISCAARYFTANGHSGVACFHNAIADNDVLARHIYSSGVVISAGLYRDTVIPRVEIAALDEHVFARFGVAPVIVWPQPVHPDVSDNNIL